MAVCALMCAFILPAHALTISGVDLADNIEINHQKLLINGAGVREKFFIDLYVGSLYLPHKSQNFAEILALPIAVIRLNITSGLITTEKMQSAIREGFDQVTKGNTSKILPEINEFMNLFTDKIQKHDQFSFVFTASSVQCYKNGHLLNNIDNGAFKQALMSIWLGSDPTQTSLKTAMLGK